MKALWNDEAGVILSAELILVLTIAVLGMIVGLVEVQCAIVAELDDLGSAFGNLDQSYSVAGLKAGGGTHPKAETAGSAYLDQPDTDACDCDTITVVCNGGGEDPDKSAP